MKVAIVGFGKEGQAALDYWRKPGNELTICDANPELTLSEDVASQLGTDYLKGLDQFDVIVRTPALHPQAIVAANADSPYILNKVTTGTNEFLKVSPTTNIIGVTGTKGKGTTSTIITKLLEASGKKVHLGGNIGIAPLDMLKDNIQPDDWVVLELSSFQLIDLKNSPKIATCLMVAPEHLNWHADMDEYIMAKQRLFARQTVHDLAVFNRANAHSQEIAGVSAASKVSYEVPSRGAQPQQTIGAYLQDDSIFMNDTLVCKASDVTLLGRHNLENVCAAIATTWELINYDTSLVQKVVREFKGLEHRLEFVAEIKGVRYYDDSFGTTPETAMVALQAFDQPKIAILGGSDKHVSFDELAQVVATHNVRSVILIGDTAPQIESALKRAGYEDIVQGGTDMPGIVAAAKAQTQPGDIVLLSTGCASFGLFKDYKDRAQQFQAAVKQLG